MSYVVIKGASVLCTNPADCTGYRWLPFVEERVGGWTRIKEFDTFRGATLAAGLMGGSAESFGAIQALDGPLGPGPAL